ncbi:2-oxo acid dehydrogenase subunit E2 [Candidatus Micrarchaeota archaeon]|nr:2-oxo acid dehydrogenase subunit E2 [Candidatus Micrarchaeota archaeon]
MFIIAKEFIFPDVGEGIHEGKIVKWHAKEGDSVKADVTIVEVETDKAIVELPSPATGTVLKINFKEGETIKVGEILVVIGEPGEKVPTPSAKPTEHAPPVQDPHAPKPPIVQSPSSSQPTAQPTIQPTPQIPRAAESGGTKQPMATPSTRKLAREMNVDLAMLTGSGPGGRITDDDVRKAGSGSAQSAKSGSSQPTQKTQSFGGVAPSGSGAPSASSAIKIPIESKDGDVRIPLSGMRKVIAERMTYSKMHIPHACGMDYVDVTRLVIIREHQKQNLLTRGIKLTYLPFVVKACVVALKKFPSFNCHFDNERGELVVKKDINIGIATDTPEGLIVPVVKNADIKSIIEIAGEIEAHAIAARERKIKLDDIKGGTFTITNVGSIGGMYSTPIINPPEVAIVGIHRIKDMPLVVDGKIEARKVMGLSICFDHRVIDGALAAEFLNVLKQYLSEPDTLFVSMM